MDIPKTGRAVILVDNEDKKQLITIKRTRYKNGNVERIYYTFPGGHLEGNETFEEATIREVKEELGVMVSIDSEILELHNEDLKRYEKFFLCKIVDGKLGTGDGSEFTNIDLEKYGKYEIVFLDVKELSSYNLLPVEAKNKIIEKYN